MNEGSLTRPMQVLIPVTQPMALTRVDDWWNWNADLAAKLIAVGVPVDIATELLADTKKGSPAPMMAAAYGMCLRRIRLDIAAGAAREQDTPAKWIAWAVSNGFEVAHLRRFTQVTLEETHEG